MSGRNRSVTKYQKSWESTFTWVQSSAKGPSFAFCSVCDRHFSVGHGGRNDLTKHQNTDLHKNAAKSSKKPSKSVTDFLVTKTDESVIRAETLFSMFIAEHNLAFAVADHFTKLAKQMFPDSAIATKFACGKTKATQIIKRALAPEFDKTVIDLCL